jgi:tetratricopeptide (TPR) repeat protein
MSEKEKSKEPGFELNYASAILILVILIPSIYTVIVNLEKPAPMPEITSAAIHSNAVPVNPASAIDAALQAANDKPGYGTYINLGLAYYNSSKYTESIKAWEKALEYNPKGELAYNNIAAAYGNMNNYDAEIEICKRALAINPNLDLAKRNMAWAQSMKDKK